MNKYLFLSVSILSSLFTNTVFAEEDDVVIPENANTAWISTNLNQSGMVMSIRAFHSPDDVDTVFDFYRSAWFSEGEIPGFLEDKMMDWTLISQKRDSENVVLQLKPTDQGGSTGFLSIAQLGGVSSPNEHGFPLPDETEEFATTYIKENGADVHTMTFITKQPVGVTAAFYKDRLSRKGWAMARSMDVKGSNVLLFNRKDDRVEMVIQPLNGEDTAIYVNRIKNDA